MGQIDVASARGQGGRVVFERNACKVISRAFEHVGGHDLL